MKKVDILECTLRDGSYSIDFQFDYKDTAVIAKMLETSGVKYIEIGHGIGMNASQSGLGMAASTDEEYLKAAMENLSKAKFGMFFIPGIGRIEDIDLAADYGMDFIRIGTNVTETDNAEKFIKYAKKKDMLIASNLMKSYTLSPSEALKNAKNVADWGADIVTIVDSAGGMLPNEVSSYITTLRDNLDCRIGFHGHNNFYLAIGNTLAAIESGATIVDTTLQGMGRSAGNAPTEIILLILKKIGYQTNIDMKKIFEIGENFIRPIMKKQGFGPIDVISGYAQFHSKFTDTIFQVAKKTGVDPLDLIVKVSEKNKIFVSEELALESAEYLQRNGSRFKRNTDSFQTQKIVLDYINNSSSFRNQYEDTIKRMNIIASKTGKLKVFILAKPIRKMKNKNSYVASFLRTNETIITAQAEISNPDDLSELIENIKEKVDYIAIDNALDCRKTYLEKNKIFFYDDGQAIVESVYGDIINNVQDLSNQVIIIGNNQYSQKIAYELLLRAKILPIIIDPIDNSGIIFHIDKKSNFPKIKIEKIDLSDISLKHFILVTLDIHENILSQNILNLFPNPLIILDGGLGNLPEDFIKKSIKNKAKLLRINMGTGLFNQILFKIQKIQQNLLKKEIALVEGVKIVSDGVIGEKGTIIVDSLEFPTRIIGVADGKGRLLQNISDYKENVNIVEKMVLFHKIG